MGETEGCIASPMETNSELGDFPSPYPCSNYILKKGLFPLPDVFVPKDRSHNSQSKKISILNFNVYRTSLLHMRREMS
jgi:hypothetical protein